MHPNPAFRNTTQERNIAFARSQAFGMLAVGTEGAPLVSHIPFLLSKDGTLAEFHLVRSNPIARKLATPSPARLAVIGPHSYVSPDWYEVDDQVPTWNYIAVHLVGEITLRPHVEMHDLLDRQSAHFEDQLLPKPPWLSTKMTSEVMERMMRQIVPCHMQVEDIHGTWKLNQNKPDEVRLRAADKVAQSGIGAHESVLAAHMRDLPN
ncbi:MAG: FMN-binding negative transcriptional regulator [Pseudomonadota bacterium]